jgi:hypothetical protein
MMGPIKWNSDFLGSEIEEEDLLTFDHPFLIGNVM